MFNPIFRPLFTLSPSFTNPNSPHLAASSYTSISLPSSNRWCQTYPEYFAISTRSPSKGALLNIYNSSYAGAHSTAQPTVFTFGPRPLRVQDFDFLAMGGIPRIAAAVGRELIVFLIGVD